jgi:hypothetical protein
MEATMTPKNRDKQLNALLDKVTPENKHAETDWRAPVGKEYGACKPGRFNGQIRVDDNFDTTPPDVIEVLENGDQDVS